MSNTQYFDAKIANKHYTIKGNKSPDHMSAVVDLVNQQLEQLSQIDPALSIMDRSLLMAVNAVSDQLTQEAKIIELEQEIKRLKEQPTVPYERKIPDPIDEQYEIPFVKQQQPTRPSKE